MVSQKKRHAQRKKKAQDEHAAASEKQQAGRKRRGRKKSLVQHQTSPLPTVDEVEEDEEDEEDNSPALNVNMDGVRSPPVSPSDIEPTQKFGHLRQARTAFAKRKRADIETRAADHAMVMRRDAVFYNNSMPDDRTDATFPVGVYGVSCPRRGKGNISAKCYHSAVILLPCCCPRLCCDNNCQLVHAPPSKFCSSLPPINL